MKGKKLTSLLSLALAACLAFSVTGCKGRDDSDGANEKPRNPIAESIDRLYAGGLHKVNVTKTDNVLISEDGSTDYKIVYPKEAHEYELAAARYIAQQMIYAVDADIEVMEEDENLAYSANDKYIAVGSCKLFEKAGLTLPEELRQDGCYIKSAGNSVFINSPTHLGIKRAATVFLEHTIGLEFIWSDTILYTAQKGEKVTLPTFDIIEQSDAAVGAVNGLYGEEAMMAAKITDADFYLPLRGDGNNVWHNSFVVFDEKTRNAHPVWVSDGGEQLCYSAHGVTDEDDPENSLEAMVEYAADWYMEDIRKYPEYSDVTFTQQDVPTWCSCEACKASAEKYGADSAVLIRFSNKLAARINEKAKAEGIERTIRVWIFAYHATKTPPVIKQADGTYKPVDESVVCKNVGVVNAPIEAKYTHKLYDSVNQSSYENIIGWNAVTDTTHFWIYETNFHNYFYPYNTFDTIAENVRFCLEQGAVQVYSQGIWNTNGLTHFTRYKSYLLSKLLWDANTDVEKARERFFEQYFGDAAEAMNTYYLEMLAHTRWIEENFEEITGGLYEAIEQAQFWPKGVVNRWLSLIDEAYAAVEKYRDTDTELYNKLVEHIKIESMSPRFMAIRLHGNDYSTETLKQMKADFKADCVELGFDLVREHDSLETIVAEW